MWLLHTSLLSHDRNCIGWELSKAIVVQRTRQLLCALLLGNRKWSSAPTVVIFMKCRRRSLDLQALLSAKHLLCCSALKRKPSQIPEQRNCIHCLLYGPSRTCLNPTAAIFCHIALFSKLCRRLSYFSGIRTRAFATTAILISLSVLWIWMSLRLH
jgi:hypothetical protein